MPVLWNYREFLAKPRCPALSERGGYGTRGMAATYPFLTFSAISFAIHGWHLMNRRKLLYGIGPKFQSCRNDFEILVLLPDFPKFPRFTFSEFKLIEVTGKGFRYAKKLNVAPAIHHLAEKQVPFGGAINLSFSPKG
ncbi:MAG: hypothetical protein KF712_20440 [Akkermansiaceae bacterium]|nr:hypothetical protein [Akkermansiaceae bacterium]